MLQAIRERSQGFIVGVIVFFISLTFALFGVQSYFTGDSEVVVAEVAGKPIVLKQFQSRLQQLKERADQIADGLFGAEYWSSGPVKMRALDQLIDERILDNSLRDAGLTVTNSYIINRLQDIRAFQQQGSFSRDIYLRSLKANGMSPKDFEARLGNDLLRAQFRAGLLGSEIITDVEAMTAYRLSEQTRDIKYVTFDAASFEGVNITEDDLLNYFKNNKENFKTEEKVNIEYLEVLYSDFLEQTNGFSDESLEAFYQENKSLFYTPEKRKVSHVLLTESKNIESKKRGELVVDLSNKLKAGQQIDEILGSTKSDYEVEGGITDFFERGIMTVEFEEKAFSLSKGETSIPFTSEYGVHILRVEEIKEENTQSFEAANERVMELYRKSIAEKRYVDFGEKLSEMSYEEADSLLGVSENLELKLKTSGFVTRKKVYRIIF